MSEAKHTPGPWAAVGSWVEHPNDNIPDICTCDPQAMGQQAREYGEQCANARLIAAAPDLLRALRRLIECGDVRDVAEAGALRQARSAIARATGSGR